MRQGVVKSKDDTRRSLEGDVNIQDKPGRSGRRQAVESKATYSFAANLSDYCSQHKHRSLENLPTVWPARVAVTTHTSGERWPNTVYLVCRHKFMSTLFNIKRLKQVTTCRKDLKMHGPYRVKLEFAHLLHQPHELDSCSDGVRHLMQK